jgi:hypothetical protein
VSFSAHFLQAEALGAIVQLSRKLNSYCRRPDLGVAVSYAAFRLAFAFSITSRISDFGQRDDAPNLIGFGNVPLPT